MKIKLDDKHILVADSYSCWIMCVGVDKDGKKFERRVSGYYPTFGMAVENYIERKIRGDKVTSLTALKNEIKALKKQVKDWKAAAEDE